MQWHQLDHMQTICTSLQTDNHTNISLLNFYRPDALPDARPTASKHWRHTICTSISPLHIQCIIPHHSVQSQPQTFCTNCTVTQLNPWPSAVQCFEHFSMMTFEHFSMMKCICVTSAHCKDKVDFFLGFFSWMLLYNNNNNNDRLTAFDPGQPG